LYCSINKKEVKDVLGRNGTWNDNNLTVEKIKQRRE